MNDGQNVFPILLLDLDGTNVPIMISIFGALSYPKHCRKISITTMCVRDDALTHCNRQVCLHVEVESCSADRRLDMLLGRVLMCSSSQAFTCQALLDESEPINHSGRRFTYTAKSSICHILKTCALYKDVDTGCFGCAGSWYGQIGCCCCHRGQ